MNARQTDMHGKYQVLHSKGSEGRDLKTGDFNLKKLGANFRFASDKVPAQNPWARTAPFNGDFILIAEFSENEGPKPVMTIPITGGSNFDINAFAVHVMSVDYAQTGGDFSIVEDTQLLLSEKKEGIYAYIHRFTLHDIHARGFVRPYCMCYISHCKRKMYSFLDGLMDEFTKVSRLFRHGNRITFIRDLEQRLSEVLAMKASSSFVNFNTQEPTGQKLKDMEKTKSNANEECECILNETKKLIEVLRPHMAHDSRIVQQFKRLESLAEGRSRSLTDAPDCYLLKLGKSNHRPPSFVKQQPSLRRAFSLPDLKDLTGQKEVKPNPRLPSCRKSMKELRHLHELCEWGAKEGLNRLRTILKHYSREAAALLIEKTETSHLERFPSLLTIGRSVVCNFRHKVEVKCVSSPWTKESSLNLPNQGCVTRQSSNGSLYSLESFQSCLEDELVGSARSGDEIISPFSPSSSFHADLQGVESSSYASSDDSRVDNIDVVSIHSDTSLGAAKERLSLADYALMDEDALSDYSEARFYRQTSTILEANPSLQLSQTSGITRSLESINMVPSDHRSIRHHKRGKKLGTFPVFRKSNPVTLAKSEKGTSICPQDVTSRSINSRNNLSVRHAAFKRSRSEGGSGGIPSGDEKLHQKRLSCSFRPEKIRLRCFAEEVSQPLESYSGSNVLFLRNNLSCGVYLLYALLSGRPVVVLAEPRNERDVRIVISALWMFVPENTSHGKAVVPWRTKPLQMADLSWLKLVGLAKNKHINVLPKSVKRYVSVLNFETDLIETPQYKGHYLRSFCNYANQWPTNAALVAFVHSVFLELANKSYVYYYVYCLGGLKWCCCKSNQRSDFGQVVEIRDASEILSRLRVYFSDAKIVQYFAELIKQQQVDFYQSQHHDQDFAAEGAVSPDSDSSAENASLLIIADLSKCAVFRNVKPLDLL